MGPLIIDHQLLVSCGDYEMCSISWRICSSVIGLRQYTSQAWKTSPIPHPRMGKIGQKKPAPVNSQMTTMNVLTTT